MLVWRFILNLLKMHDKSAIINKTFVIKIRQSTFWFEEVDIKRIVMHETQVVTFYPVDR